MFNNKHEPPKYLIVQSIRFYVLKTDNNRKYILLILRQNNGKK